MKKIGIIAALIIVIALSGAGMLAIKNGWFNDEKNSDQENYVLKINGEFVSPEDFQKGENDFFMKYRRNSEMSRKSDEERNDLMVEEISENIVLENYLSKDSGVNVTQGEVDEYIKKYVEAKYDTPALMTNFMQSSGYGNNDDMKKGIMEYIRNHKAFLKAAKDYGIVIEDAKLKEEYEKHKQDSKIVNIRHIFIGFEGRTEEEALSLANEVHGKISSKEDFDTLAKEYSEDDQTKNKGGIITDLIYGIHESDFDNVVFSSEPEKLLRPVKTSKGYEIVYVEKIKEFYRSEEGYKEILMVDAFLKSDKYKEWLNKLKSEAQIEILDPSFKGYRLFKNGNFKEAAHEYEKAFKREKFALYAEKAIECNKMIKNWDEVIRLSKLAIREDAKNPIFYVYQGEGHYRKGDKEQGIKLFDKVEEMAKDNMYIMGILQNLYQELNIKSAN